MSTVASGGGRLAQVALRVNDLDRAIAFYRDVLGAPFVAKFDPPGLAFFDLGGNPTAARSRRAARAALLAGRRHRGRL